MPTWEPPCGETCELNFVIECGKSTQTGFEVRRSRRCNALKKSTTNKKNGTIKAFLMHLAPCIIKIFRVHKDLKKKTYPRIS